jgi:glyoxylase-like metal-dependent hydrolase (beta-lactamase superfamily II)
VTLHWLRVGSCRHPEWITLRGGRWGLATFPSLCALIVHPTFGPILYDTGYADHFDEETRSFPNRLYRWVTPVQLPPEERLSAQLARRGVRMEDVARVLISHLHADHVAGLRDLPRSRFTALRDDVTTNLGRTGFGAVRRAFLPGLLPGDFGARLDFADDLPVVDLGVQWAPFDRGYDLLGDRSVIGVPLPGHSPAQLGVLLFDHEGRPVMLAADACWSTRAWQENRLPSPVARLLLHNWDRYCQTLSGLHELGTRSPDLRILPSHCRAAWEAFQPPDHPALTYGRTAHA